MNKERKVDEQYHPHCPALFLVGSTDSRFWTGAWLQDNVCVCALLGERGKVGWGKWIAYKEHVTKSFMLAYQLVKDVCRHAFSDLWTWRTGYRGRLLWQMRSCTSPFWRLLIKISPVTWKVSSGRNAAIKEICGWVLAVFYVACCFIDLAYFHLKFQTTHQNWAPKNCISLLKSQKGCTATTNFTTNQEIELGLFLSWRWEMFESFCWIAGGWLLRKAWKIYDKVYKEVSSMHERSAMDNVVNVQGNPGTSIDTTNQLTPSSSSNGKFRIGHLFQECLAKKNWFSLRFVHTILEVHSGCTTVLSLSVLYWHFHTLSVTLSIKQNIFCAVVCF